MKMKCRPIPVFNHERFFSRIKVDTDSGCWDWQGPIHAGYGKFHIGKPQYVAHRVSYDLFVGIKENYTVIDHRCMNKVCVNPEHLREVTIRENTLENSNCDAVAKKASTHCKYGHELSGANIRLSYGVYGGERRNCLVCMKRRQDEWYARVKEKRKLKI